MLPTVQRIVSPHYTRVPACSSTQSIGCLLEHAGTLHYTVMQTVLMYLLLRIIKLFELFDIRNLSNIFHSRLFCGIPALLEIYCFSLATCSEMESCFTRHSCKIKRIAKISVWNGVLFHSFYIFQLI